MRRVVVLGGQGLFGGTILDRLRVLGVPAIVAGRRGAEIIADADDPDSLHRAFRSGDVVVDAAGPFQRRTLALVEAAIRTGFDVVDINDNLSYAEQLLAQSSRIQNAGIRVLSSASSVSAVSALAVKQSGIRAPVSVQTVLAPASRHTANRGSALSLIQSIGQPVRTLRDGKLESLRGGSESRRMALPEPLGTIRGWLFESADAVYLPLIWPTLRDVNMYVDTNTPGVNGLLRCGARSPALRRMLESQVSLGTRISRIFGATRGGLGYEIRSADGPLARVVVFSDEASYVTAVAPAVLAAHSLAHDEFELEGLIRPDQHVSGNELLRYLDKCGIRVAMAA